MRSVLLNVTQASQLPLALEICRRIYRTGIKPLLVSNADQLELRERMTALAARENRTIIFAEYQTDDETTAQPRPFIWKWRFYRHSVPEDAETTFRVLLRNYERHFAWARSLIDKQEVVAVIVFEDNLSSDRPLLHAAQAAKVPVIDCPYEVSGEEDFARDIAEKFDRDEAVLVDRDPFGRLVRSAFPKWVRKTSRGDILPFAGAVVAAYEAAKISPPNPWVVHSGSVDYLASESEHFSKLYVKYGVPRTRIKTIGSVYADIVFEGIHKNPMLRKAFEEKSKIEDGRTRVLLSLPPNFHSTRGAFTEFRSYEETITTLAAELSRVDNLAVKASIHPNTLPKEVEIYERHFEIAASPVVQEIAECDIYVTCQSSTIRWAICARKPVVNWDIYKFGIELWKQSPGVLAKHSLAECVQTVSELREPPYYAKVSQLQADDAPKWALFDGRSSQRLSNLLSEVSAPR